MFLVFGTILVLVAAGFYAKFNLKRIQKWIFPPFGTMLVFGGSFFLFKIQVRKHSKIELFTFWHDLSWFWWQPFSSQNSIKKIWKNWFPHLLARSWFWRQLFSFQHLIKKYSKLIFPAFVPMTNIDGANISKCEMVAQLKEYSKIDFSSFWYDLGFVGSFFLVLFQFKKVLEIWFFQLLARSSFW